MPRKFSSSFQGETITPAPEKIYYTSVHLNNNENKDVLVKWKELGEEKSVLIPLGGALLQDFVIKEDGDPEKVVFTAYDPGNMAIIPINNKENLAVTPTIMKNTVTANIGQGAGILYFYVKAVSAIFYQVFIFFK